MRINIEHFIVNTLVDLFRSGLWQEIGGKIVKKFSFDPWRQFPSYFSDPSSKYIFIYFLYFSFFCSNICTRTNENPRNWRFTEVTYSSKCLMLTNVWVLFDILFFLCITFLLFVPPISCTFKFLLPFSIKFLCFIYFK